MKPLAVTLVASLAVAAWPAPAAAQEKVRPRLYVPSPQPVVEKMLELAGVKKDDVLYDVGCGDGRTLVTAVKKDGCRARGFEMLPDLVEQARQNVQRQGLAARASVEKVEALDFVDLSGATVVTAYILPERL